jgi:type IV pilus assembly protein PilO
MPLSTEDRTQIQNFGVLAVMAVAAVIFIPGPDYGIPVGIYNLYNSIGRLEKSLASEREKYDKEKLRIDRIPALERELQERQPEIQRYEARLPKSTKVPELYRDIDRFKQYSSLDIRDQTRLDPVDKGDYLELPIRIEAKGSFDSIATFINQLERNQRFAQVKELKIIEKPGETTGEDQQDFENHEATMRISTFMFKDQLVAQESKAKSAGQTSGQPGETAKTK